MDTIVAPATPPGRGGVSIVRLSGPESLPIAKAITRLTRDPESHRARYTQVLDQTGHTLDDALLTYFKSPHSYTGEDVVEIATHGAPVVVQTVVERCLARGARLAGPGEFTERAFLNRRLDLTAAEAVRDLIDSTTVAQARLAAEQLGGSLQREVRSVKDALVTLIATLEAGIDFAEDDLETVSSSKIQTNIESIRPSLETLLQSFTHGRLVREGLRLAIVGMPNAGKSSLFNLLLARERAIVTPIAGTTRDVVSERARIGDLPVELLDTAGLRETSDPVERIGVQRSREAIAEADLVLEILDSTARFTPLGHCHLVRSEGPAFHSASAQQEHEAGGSSGLQAADSTFVKGRALAPARPATEPSFRPEQTASSFAERRNLHFHLANAQHEPERPSGPEVETDRPKTEALAPEVTNPQKANILRIHNKADLLTNKQRQILTDQGALLTSALTGEGLEALREAVLHAAGANPHHAEHATLTNTRQRDAIAATLAALDRALQATHTNTPHEMLLLDLYEALATLDSLTGQTTPDDVLHHIFTTFCIGK